MASASTAARLASRGVLRLSGADSLKLLQGLVTVDVNRLLADDARALYGAFLNRRGRVLHTAFLVRGASPDEILLDVDAGRLDDLRSHLVRHKLRAQAEVSDASGDLAVVAAPSGTVEEKDASTFFGDPRGDFLGARAVIPADEAPAHSPAREKAHERARVLAGVPGAHEMRGEPLPLTLGLHRLGAVDFDKGCYLGQELTARTHYTGVLRKRLMPIAVGEEAAVRAALEKGGGASALSDADEVRISAGMKVLKEAGGVAGEVTSCVGNVGLAVVGLKDAFLGEERVGKELKLEDGRVAVAWRPEWWGEGEADRSVAG